MKELRIIKPLIISLILLIGLPFFRGFVNQDSISIGAYQQNDNKNTTPQKGKKPKKKSTPTSPQKPTKELRDTLTRKSESELPFQQGEEFNETDTTFSTEDTAKGIQEVNYLTNWISLEHIGKKERLSLIQEIVAESSRHVLKRKKLDFNQTEKLNRQWEFDRKSLNNKWLDDFLMKEGKFKESSEQLDSLRQAFQEAKIKISNLQQDESSIRKNIELYEKRIDNLLSTITKLDNEYESRLAKISYSICIISRVKIEQDEPIDSLRILLQNAAIEKAIKEIKGVEVQKMTIINKDSIISNIISKKEQALTRISDNLEKFQLIDDQMTHTQIFRIGVFPFEKYAIKKAIMENEQLTSLNKYKQSVEVSVAKDDETFFSQLKLKKVEIKFIQSQHQSVIDNNRKVEERIVMYKKDYDQKKQKTLLSLGRFRDIKDSLKVMLENRSKEIINENLRTQDIEKARTTFDSEYLSSKTNYENFWKNKIEYVNKNKQSQLGNIPTTQADHFRKLAEETYSAEKELKNDLSTSVILTVGSENAETEIRKISSREVKYTPEVIAFKILYLTIANIEDDAYGLLNIAYKIRWTPIGTLLSMIKDTLIDPQHNKIWLYRPSEVTSPRYVDENQPPGFRLPTLQELTDLSKHRDEYLDEKNEDVFILLKCDVEAPFLTNEQIQDGYSNYYKGYDFISNSETKENEVSAVNLFWVKDVKLTSDE
ncbi:MAG: hypothetical protein FJ218_07415 [Ignavibacteria bacterium]|nr:hypothetical protein [Ignavibacteria bacterium]